MKHYWAKYIKNENCLFRVDTRIYLKPVERPKSTDNCIGAIVGKNPGSALPQDNQITEVLAPIDLNNDKLLPTVKNIILKSTEQLNEGDYVQVLNLFYLCNNNLSEAIGQIEKNNRFIICPSEKNNFRWVWYVWGGPEKRLNSYKERFNQIDSVNHFFFDNSIKKIQTKQPKLEYSARHTQGLAHKFVLPFFRELLKK